jgi:glycosyltransferase involved in cell wall biosynthesis
MKHNSRNIWVIYPFTPNAIGEDDDYVIKSNSSNAFIVSLRKLHESSSRLIKAIFMTEKLNSYEVDENGIIFRFLPVSFNPYRGSAGFGRQWSFKLLSELTQEKPELVFLFIGGGWFAIFLALVCHLLKVPYCPIIAGWGTSTRRSQKWYYRNALHVIVHTNAHKETFNKVGVNTSNFLVVSMGVDTDLFSLKPTGDFLKIDRPIRFVHAGRIEPRKNLLGALRIFQLVRRSYPDSYFDIVGPGSNVDYYQQVLSFIQVNGLADRVILRGFVPNDKMPEIYAKADLMLFPTLSESFGFVIAESMACGTPVAALSGRGSPDEIIEDGVDGLLAIEEEGLAESILRLLAEPKKIEIMGRMARHKVESLYSADRTYSQVLGLLREAESKNNR